MFNLKNYTLDELTSLLQSQGHPRFMGRQVFGWVYKRGVGDFDLMTDLSKDAREFLKKNFYFSKNSLLKKEKSLDRTQKFLFGLEDKNCIETVLIPESGRNTLCLSSQVGCKFNCNFCLSGQGGFKRNLEVYEIIDQYLNAISITGKKITNIVFMGIGEPLDNFTSIVKTVKILTEASGINFSKRRISISTCGLTPQIKRLAELHLGIRLSVSLHSAIDRVRSRIMPVNRKYPLAGLMKAVKVFIHQEKYPVTFEYTLVKGLNCSLQDARKLAQLLRGINCKLNLIPLNYSSTKIQSPSEKEINDFKKELKKNGVFFTLRKSKGQDIRAACGQLRASHKRGR